MKVTATLAVLAREDSGLTPAEAANRLRISTAYLRKIELHGGAPYCLAVRLARLYKTSLHAFL